MVVAVDKWLYSKGIVNSDFTVYLFYLFLLK